MNRSNIKYMVSGETGPGTLIEKAVDLVRAYWPQKEIFNHARDKIIIYYRTRAEAGILAEILEYSLYISEFGIVQEKADIITGWLSNINQLVIAATSALRVGFDYLHIRWVIHINTPEKVSAFSQKSGRAGRNGGKALSIVLLRVVWKLQRDASLLSD